MAFARIMEVIRQRQQKLDDLSHRMELAERNLLQQMHRRWETVSAAVRHYDLRLVLSGVHKELDSKTAALVAVTRNVLLQHRVRTERLDTALQSRFTVAIIFRGDSRGLDAGGNRGKDYGAGPGGDEISARLARGQIQAQVTKLDQ